MSVCVKTMWGRNAYVTKACFSSPFLYIFRTYENFPSKELASLRSFNTDTQEVNTTTSKFKGEKYILAVI